METANLIRYVHGSKDSTDLDVVYIVDTLPSLAECKLFCAEDKAENRNIASIKDGVISDCYKGTVDELNNSLLRTYSLHEQTHPLLIERTLDRDIPRKVCRSLRIVLSHFSRCQYRPMIKEALRTSWNYRISALSFLAEKKDIDFSSLNKNMTAEDIKKIIAFQIGQVAGLFEGNEYYTKAEISEAYPELRQFLYRKPDSDMDVFRKWFNKFIDLLCKIKVKNGDTQDPIFVDYNESINLHDEIATKIK